MVVSGRLSLFSTQNVLVSGVVFGAAMLAGRRLEKVNIETRRGAGVLSQLWLRGIESNRRDMVAWLLLCVRAGFLISDMIDFLDLAEEVVEHPGENGDVGDVSEAEPVSPPLSAFREGEGGPAPSLRSTIEAMDYTRS